MSRDHIRIQAEAMIRSAEIDDYNRRVEEVVKERSAVIPDQIEALQKALEKVRKEIEKNKVSWEKTKRKVVANKEFISKTEAQIREHNHNIEEKRNLLKKLEDVARERQTQPSILRPVLEKVQNEIDELVRTVPETITYQCIEPDFSVFKFENKVLHRLEQVLQSRLKTLQKNTEEEKWRTQYLEYASAHGLLCSPDTLVNKCNLHHQHYLLEEYTVDCHCEASPPEPGQDTEYGEYVDYGETPDHYFRYGECRCSYGTKMDFVFDPSEMELGFINSARPVGHLERH